jgi:hypothetical protein
MPGASRLAGGDDKAASRRSRLARHLLIVMIQSSEIHAHDN